MDNNKQKQSKIIFLKSKFFIYRFVHYFSFLLIPIWIQKSVNLSLAFQVLMMVFYIMFMVSQWFFLGKEIDHKLRIYFNINSSMDRVVYRLILGMGFFIIYLNLLSILPGKWIYNCFWITWILLGLFYSWPTRGKIIQESVTTNFSEIKYLDSFEKTLLLLSLLIFIISFPNIPNLTDKEALMLFFDPEDNFSFQYWNFLTVNYYPFYKYPMLFKLSWVMHFYIIGSGLFIMVFYTLLRFFISRRLALLGIFSIISSWSYSKIFGNNLGFLVNSTYPLIWVWSLLWLAKSSVYRIGLFTGIVSYIGIVINNLFSFLFIPKLVYLTFFLKNKNLWFRKKFIKYFLPGFSLFLLTFITRIDSVIMPNIMNNSSLNIFIQAINQKAFFTLSLIGILIFILKYCNIKPHYINNFKLNRNVSGEILFCILSLIFLSLFINSIFISGFTSLWILAFFSIITLEFLFQKISTFRSSRNIIYVIYILICLLDSRLEVRLKYFYRMFF